VNCIKNEPYQKWTGIKSRVVDSDWLESGSGSSILAQSGSRSEPSQKGTLKNFFYINFVKSNLKFKNKLKSSVNDAGAGSVWSHIIGWSRSCKPMQLLLRTDVQHDKHVSKRGGGTVFPSVVEPHHFGGAVAATRCGSGIKIFYPLPLQNDAAPQNSFFLNCSSLNIRFSAGAASLDGSGCS
jgi:hypothetical protein